MSTSTKGLLSDADALIRLRKSKLDSQKVLQLDGEKAGKLWALQKAEYDELLRLEAADIDDIDDENPGVWVANIVTDNDHHSHAQFFHDARTDHPSSSADFWAGFVSAAVGVLNWEREQP